MRNPPRHVCLRPLLATLLLAVALSTRAQADPIRLGERLPDQRVFSNTTEIATQGKVHTTKADGGKDELQLDATASFEFLSRRLPAAGRDAQAVRELREFLKAELRTKVSGYETSAQLPPDRRLIVANGKREGLTSYSLQGPLSREAADLLEIPGDPLALGGTLPIGEVDVGGEWVPEDWVLQMLTGVEAVQKSELKCKLEQVTAAAAKFTFSGKIVGQKLGTNTAINVLGVAIFLRDAQYISQAKVSYSIAGDVGAVNPGLQTSVTVTFSRGLAQNPGNLTDERVQSIPLEAPPQEARLTYEAPPWGIRLSHDRDWHLFQALYDGAAPVAIFRLMKQGSLVAQCNMSPAPNSLPGQPVPLEKFEADIAQSLGDRLGEVLSREKLPVQNGRQVYRLAVSGNVMLKSDAGRKPLPMTWIYYLVSDPQGRQASFVFSVEPALMEQLGTLDRELVGTLEFTPAKQASRK